MPVREIVDSTLCKSLEAKPLQHTEHQQLEAFSSEPKPHTLQDNNLISLFDENKNLNDSGNPPRPTLDLRAGGLCKIFISGGSGWRDLSTHWLGPGA